MTERLTIETLGQKGDGIAHVGGAAVFVPFTLPGEIVEIERQGERGRLLQVETASPERVEAPCPHFGRCGGCELQHMSDSAYRAFKRETVVEAFRRVGLEPQVADLVPCAPHSRRRAVFSALRVDSRVLFGFHEALSHRIAPISTCLVTVPEIANRLDFFEKLAVAMIDRKRELRMVVTYTAAGLDIAVSDAARLDDKLRQRVLSLALAPGVARLAIDGETIVEPQAPRIDVDGIGVPLPPGAFLQAVASAEGAMAEIALPHFGKAKQVADLFCGVGTFTLRLARRHPVHGVEFDSPALAALDHARRGIPGLKPVTTERRDLFRRPMTTKELNRFDGVLFDPPRAGAEAQCRELAKSTVKRVAAVSCNPASLARDAAILVEGGYKLLSVTPIDQFLWSHHVEAVALFER
ncbi:class I SAM-dependent RNA methyltransferase [Aureimonas sp. D3]|uniref:class I SAM-dependent RNA methyltransferase n=1 Tax=Aureimonas sp. D3 TaxID=1638164 RepID=UPI000786741E|nr:class I SAM-dependent RNA methyltransferase [Aureimonas sp. D3]